MAEARPWRGAVAVIASALALAIGAAPARAVILPPTTIDGPNTQGMSLGGVAMAPDGTGGLVYTKTVGGVAHVFASRYNGTNWSSPIRVDGEEAFAGSQPRIAAVKNGRLLVVWVTPVATLVKGEVRYGLYSSSLGPGAEEFSSALLVDQNVGEGTGVDPSVAGTTPGNAIVAYRVVTYTFPKPPPTQNPAVQLRPGDVMAEIRAARLEGGRWSKLPPLNRNLAASMRTPTEANAPQVAIGATGRAVVAWQEPDLSGAARVLVRRIAGSTPGPIFLASPESFNGKSLSEDATSFSLGVTALDRARLAVRVEGSATSPLGGPRIFLTSFGSNAKPGGGTPVGPEPVDGAGAPPAQPIGPPAMSTVDDAGVGGAMFMAFASGSAIRTITVDEQNKPREPETAPGPPALPGSPAVTAVDPEGGDVVAYEAVGEEGLPAVAVYQSFPESGSQTGLLYGPIGGEVSQLEGGDSGAGDALVAFREGEAGQFAIIADRIATAPTAFAVRVPKKWVAPRKATVRWSPPESAVGNLEYSLLVNGRTVRSGLRGLRFTPPAPLLYDGVGRVQVIATDRLGEEVLSRSAKMRVDSQPPRFQVKARRRSDIVRIKLKDPQSGLLPRPTRIAFGDGTGARHGASFTHRYKRSGTYRIRLRAEDKVGNALVQRVAVKVG
jgi:PKD domain